MGYAYRKEDAHLANGIASGIPSDRVPRIPDHLSLTGPQIDLNLKNNLLGGF
jgi:hypothetical protein